jgi:type I restriction enzyme S subunit
MTVSWTPTTLGAICKFQAGDGFPKDLQGNEDGEHPVAKVSDMNLAGNELFIINANNWLSKKAVGQGFKLHPPGAVIFAKIGVALTSNRRRLLVRPTVIDNNMMSATCTKDIDPRWFYSLLSTLDFNEISSGSALPFLTVRDLSRIPVSVPPLPEQRAIAATLGALDDKIELNRRMNETLEAMARALFRDWFVDFGPTRAKMAGTTPYLSPALWSLFPDRLDDAGKPEGWEADTLGAIATARTEGVDPATVSETTPYIGLEHMPRGSIALSEWEGAAKVSSNKGAFEAGDFLFGKLRPYFHKVGVAPVSGICSTDIVVVRPSAPSWRGFVIACISDADFVAYTDKTSTGTKMPRTSWRIMSKYPATLPSIGAVEAFDALVAPMLGRIRANILESRTLAQTRDLLLPRLMSGELRVAGAEHAVEAVL